MNEGRTDVASINVNASPEKAYAALIDGRAVGRWLPPVDMRGEVHKYDARVGGEYHITLTYLKPHAATPGKTSEDRDSVKGKFLELIPNKKVVWSGDFDSDDPAFAGTMKMTWTLEPTNAVTKITVTAENVPPGIRQEDHIEGLSSTLQNLAKYLS